jgi:hypothetical protein
MRLKNFYLQLTANNGLDQGDDSYVHRTASERYRIQQLDEVIEGIDDLFVDAIWHELERQLPRERVRCVVAEVALGFQDAAVKTFLPIFVHRQALERLRLELNENTSRDNFLLDEQP